MNNNRHTDYEPLPLVARLIDDYLEEGAEYCSSYITDCLFERGTYSSDAEGGFHGEIVGFGIKMPSGNGVLLKEGGQWSLQIKDFVIDYWERPFSVTRVQKHELLNELCEDLVEETTAQINSIKFDAHAQQ